MDQEHEQALMTAIQQEETLTKELEQEERKEIIVDTEPEMEEPDDMEEDDTAVSAVRLEPSDIY